MRASLASARCAGLASCTRRTRCRTARCGECTLRIPRTHARLSSSVAAFHHVDPCSPTCSFVFRSCHVSTSGCAFHRFVLRRDAARQHSKPSPTNTETSENLILMGTTSAFPASLDVVMPEASEKQACVGDLLELGAPPIQRTRSPLQRGGALLSASVLSRVSV